MHSDFVFPKSVRLLKRADFLIVQGSSFRHVTRHMVFRYLENQQGFFRVGFTVTKKFGNAVRRNRIRRRMREAVRLNMPLLRPFALDVVVMPRNGTHTVAFHQLLEEVKGFANRLREFRT